MKRYSADHPVILLLAAQLNIPKPYALGIIGVLMEWASRYAAGADIAMWPARAIAAAADWPGDPDAFVAALVESKWLAEDDSGPLLRLIVIDLMEDHYETESTRENLS